MQLLNLFVSEFNDFHIQRRVGHAVVPLDRGSLDIVVYHLAGDLPVSHCTHNRGGPRDNVSARKDPFHSAVQRRQVDLDGAPLGKLEPIAVYERIDVRLLTDGWDQSVNLDREL